MSETTFPSGRAGAAADGGSEGAGGQKGAGGTVEVRLNGKDRRVASGLDVAGLLDSLDLLPGMVVVEHNGEILARDAYVGTPVSEGDRIELVHFVGGG